MSFINNAKGLPLLGVAIKPPYRGAVSYEEQNKIIYKGALFYDPHTGLPFTTVFMRSKTNLGVAWLPIDRFSVVPWVELICTEWAKSDQLRFPNFGDWTKNQEWMTNEEIALRTAADTLILELEKLTGEYKNRISKLEEDLTHASLLVNGGKRRLITAQGNELVDEVA